MNSLKWFYENKKKILAALVALLTGIYGFTQLSEESFDDKIAKQMLDNAKSIQIYLENGEANVTEK